MVPFQYFHSSFHRLAGLLLDRFAITFSFPADVPCPGLLPSYDLFNQVYDICILSLIRMFFLSLCVIFNIYFLLLFVQLLAWYLPG